MYHSSNVFTLIELLKNIAWMPTSGPTLEDIAIYNTNWEDHNSLTLLFGSLRANKGIYMNFKQFNVKTRLEKGTRLLLTTGLNFRWREEWIRKNPVNFYHLAMNTSSVILDSDLSGLQHTGLSNPLAHPGSFRYVARTHSSDLSSSVISQIKIFSDSEIAFIIGS